MESLPEEWRSVPGFQFYEASSLGRVRSLDRMVQHGPSAPGVLCLRKGKVLKQIPHKGYLIVHLSAGVKPVNFGVHQVVAMAFHGPCPEGLVVDHKDTNKHNNRPENLEYVTNTENVLRQYRTGLLSNKGETNGRSLLTEQQARESIERIRNGETCKSIAESFGVRVHVIYHIKQGKNWKYLLSEESNERNPQG